MIFWTLTQFTIGGALADAALLLSAGCLLVLLGRTRSITITTALLLLATGWVVTGFNVVFRIWYVSHSMYGTGSYATRLQHEDLVASAAIPILVASLLTALLVAAWITLRRGEVRMEKKGVLSVTLLVVVASVLATCVGIGLLKELHLR